MNRCISVAWLVAALVTCAACGREGASTRTADADNALMERYKGNLLSSVGIEPKPGSITVTYLGTSMLLFDDGMTQLLINPSLTRPADPASTTTRPDTTRIDEAMKALHAKRIGAIFVAGADARVADATYIARKTGATLFGPAAALEIGRAHGLPERQLAPYAPGATVRVGKFRIDQIASKAAPLPKGKSGGRSPGASADFLIRKGSRSILVKSATNFIPSALDHVNADVLFLAIGSLTEQSDYFQDLYYRQTVGQVRPDLVIPLQWDDATQPPSRKLSPSAGTPAAFDFLIGRLQQDKIKFGLMQGYHTTELFDARSCAFPIAAEGQ
jgi:L-ascorbate metabolism protein UlaG (beta-lactamase superfamily)